MMKFDKWIQAALPCSSSIKYEVMITFDHTRGNGTTRSPQGLTLPTPAEYTKGVRLFLNRYNNRCKKSRQIRLIGAWNEPNYQNQPTYGPLIKNAGVYWSQAFKICHSTYTCFVPAGELIDYAPDDIALHIRRYKKGMNRKQGAAAWSFHGYRSSHISLGQGNTRIKRILTEITPGAKLWFTEQGGRYDVKPGDTPKPLEDECRLMRLRELSSRITRFWHYQLLGPGPGAENFDSALIGARNPDNGSRPQYDVFRFFSAKTGSGYGDLCPAGVRSEPKTQP